MREEGWEEIKKMFGLKISVDYREEMEVVDSYDVDKGDLSNESDVGKGGENNE